MFFVDDCKRRSLLLRSFSKSSHYDYYCFIVQRDDVIRFSVQSIKAQRMFSSHIIQSEVSILQAPAYMKRHRIGASQAGIEL